VVVVVVVVVKRDLASIVQGFHPLLSTNGMT